jgi:hypothetical protein
MTRFISDKSQIEPSKVVTTYYGKGGEECDKDKAIIYHISTDTRDTYFSIVQNGGIFNPDSLRFPRPVQYGKISKECFTKFLSALISGKQSDYEKAAREYRKS